MCSMTAIEQLIRELSTMPEELVAELLEHARAMKADDGRGSLDTAIASEPSLAKDWLSPVEDEAWKDL